jgi:hypothetical protein
MADKLEWKRYARIPFYVDGIQVTEENMEALAEFSRGDIRTDKDGRKYIKVPVQKPLGDRQTMAYVGDHLLYSATGFKIFTDFAFNKNFEEVKETQNAFENAPDGDQIAEDIERENEEDREIVPSVPQNSFDSSSIKISD